MGKTLYTEHIFWDEKRRKIYSNVETKVVNGDEITVGTGFESDDEMKNIQFKKTKGRIMIDTTKTITTDTVKTDLDKKDKVKK